MEEIDRVENFHKIKSVFLKKGLQDLYAEVYRKYLASLSQVPEGGIILEVGSGAGFIKKYIPQVVTSDVLAYPDIDQIVDATKMPFKDGSVRAIFMLNVFHHIPDVESFLSEAQRCLKPGGRLFIVDQYPGFPSYIIYKYFHHEPFDETAAHWKFESTGPLSGANGALAWIVFIRDRRKFEKLFPDLSVVGIRTHTPLRYWLAGGLKRWSLLPSILFPLMTFIDRLLVKVSPKFGSFMDIEINKI